MLYSLEYYFVFADKDECTDSSLNDCNPTTQMCMNLHGTFACDCKTGYMWDYDADKCVGKCAKICS